MKNGESNDKKVVSLSSRLKRRVRRLFGQQTVEEWNRIRLSELELEERDVLYRETSLDNFPRPTGFICSNCGRNRVFDEAHIDHKDRFWKRQTICYKCGQIIYRYL